MKSFLIMLLFLIPFMGITQTKLEKQIIEIIENGIPTTVVIGPANPAQMRNLTNLKIYPNPTNHILTITFYLAADIDVEYLILDIGGKIMQRGELGGFKGEFMGKINIGGLPDGLYIMKVMAENESDERLIKKIKS